MQLPGNSNNANENGTTRSSEDDPEHTNIISPESETPGATVVLESTKRETPLMTADTERGLLDLESTQTSKENIRVRLQADRGKNN